MNIWNDLDGLPETPLRCVGSIGNYDGVHLGHQTILQRTLRDARHRESAALLISFDPHPAAVIAPDRRPRLLQTRRQKLDALEHTGLTDLLLIRFTPAIGGLSGEAFMTELLLPRIRLEAIHVGENFRFGTGRSGDVELLRTLGERHGFAVHAVAPVQVDGLVISSSAIRKQIEEGAIERAREMLGRPFSLNGEVVRGDGRGRSLDFPTANLELENELLPLAGVYVTEVVVRGTRHAALTNVGVRPTFGGRVATVESHLLDYSGDLYTARIEIRFLARLRDETCFAGADELSDQIARDRAAAEAYFQNVPIS